MLKLRDYQEKALAAVQTDWANGEDAVLITVATGGGKTAIFCALIDRLAQAQPGARFLVLAHRQELIDQPRDRMLQYFPQWAGRIGIVMAEQNQVDAQMVIATVQTLQSPARLAQLLAAGPIDYVITDEAHHAVATSYQNVYKALRDFNPALKHLGVTATPKRADKAGLRAVYGKESAHYGIRELVKAAHLVPPRWLAIQTGISIASVAKTYGEDGGDFNQKQLADVYETANCFDLVVESHGKYAQGRKAIAYCVSVAGAHDLAQAFRDAGYRAGSADGTTSREERKTTLDAFRRGELDVLCNCALWTEGLDVPEVACIHQVRPTRSDGLYTQIIGRALRPVPGKVDALILDYAPVEARDIVMAGDVLGVEAKKAVYIKETAQPGEFIAGITFDGEVKWLSGSPMELISRSLAYLDLSPWVWTKDASGWLILPLGKGSDDTDRTLAMSPVSDKMTLYLVAKEPVDQWPRVYVAQTGSFEDLSAWSEEYAEKRGTAILAAKGKAWRKAPASEAQEKFARNLKVWQDGMSKGQCAEAITVCLTMRALRKAQYVK